MKHSDDIAFAFGNLKNQLGLTHEPALSIDQQQQLSMAAATDNHTVVSNCLADSHHGQFSITITHDVDWLNPYHPFAWIQSTRNGLLQKPRISFKQLWQRDLFLRNCERLLQTEQQLNIQSVWCLGAQPTEGLGRYDIRYSANNPLLKELIALVKSYHQTIGLHSSYHAVTHATLQAEANQLSELTGEPIHYHRSHYLNGDTESRYMQLDQSGIQYELGSGYARKVALRGGIPGKLHPLNSKTQNLHAVSVVPLVLMDNIFFIKPQHEVLHELTNILKVIRDYQGPACLLFHPENFLLKPQLWETFHEIIHICKQEKAILTYPTPLS